MARSSVTEVVCSSVTEAVPTPCRTKLPKTPLSAVSPDFGTPVHTSVESSVREAVPTPCRTKLQLTPFSAVSPNYGTPVDPFAPSRTLAYTPPQRLQNRRSHASNCQESQQPQRIEQPQKPVFADAAVQTDSIDINIDEDEESQDRWLCVCRLSRCGGCLFWWMLRNSLRVIIVLALLLPHLTCSPRKSQPSLHVQEYDITSSFSRAVIAPSFIERAACHISEDICSLESLMSAHSPAAHQLHTVDFSSPESSEITSASNIAQQLSEGEFKRPESSKIASGPEAADLQHDGIKQMKVASLTEDLPVWKGCRTMASLLGRVFQFGRL